jgi:CPA2 family monovalent cation:H+ antiporter-2
MWPTARPALEVPMHDTLQLVLILLAAAVFIVVLFRRLDLPPMLGYLLVGVALSPHALGIIPDTGEARYLAEFGVVFLMFSIGLEFSLPRLFTMKRIVFGLGATQVAVTMLLVGAASVALGLDWRAGLGLGGVLAMSSTAIVGKMLEDRMEINSQHGRQIMGILLFQDIAVVPLLIVIPALAEPAKDLGMTLAIALVKAAVVLTLLLFVGQRLLRPWFHLVAGFKSAELFVLNVLLITLGLAFLTEQAGLSLALGAFLAGALISETEYRYQVEADIRPFRDVLLGLFFVTIGMQLDFSVVASNFGWVSLVLVALLLAKGLIIGALGLLFGANRATASRVGLSLAQAGEFGFVLLALAGRVNVVGEPALQIVLAAMLLSMLAAPFIIEHSEHLARHVSGAEWLNQAMAIHQIAVHAMASDAHIIICGYERSGQNLARFLEREGVDWVALDLDPKRVREAGSAGENVVFGDAGRREVLVAAGLMRAKALVITYSDVNLGLKTLANVQALRPDLPVIARAPDDSELERLKSAGAVEVVSENMEGALMLASHALLFAGVPFSRVLEQIRKTREERYSLFHGFFRGSTDEAVGATEDFHPRLHSIVIADGAAAVGKTLGEIELEGDGVDVTAVRRHNVRALDPLPETRLRAGDVVVLRGSEKDLAAAEMRLMQGR